MFEKSYKNEMDKIKPDNYVKYKIRNKLERNEKTPEMRFKARFGAAIAAVLCVAVIVSVLGILDRHTPATSTKTENITLMKTVKNYNAVYDTLEKFKPTLFDILTDFLGSSSKDAMNAINGGAADGMVGESSTAVNENAEHSETTTQVEGVDEADIVKTDGKFIYILSASYKYNTEALIKIVDATETEPKQINSIVIKDIYAREMYLIGDRLIVLGNSQNAKTVAVIYDISDPYKPKQIEICTQSGAYNTSRLISEKLYVITDFYVETDSMKKNNAESFIPKIESADFNGTVSADCIYLYDNCSRPEYTIVTAFDISDGKMLSAQSVLGGSYTVYASTDNIITASTSDNAKTQVAKFKISEKEIKLNATAEINGNLLNQFSIDEYKGYFRFVLTDYNKDTSVNSLVVLDENFKETGKITDIAPGERVYSVRFMGDTAYFVTFRQVDPLFSVDLSDPENPNIIGALKIPGFSDYLFPFGDGKLLGIGRNADENTGLVGSIKLSMFDISNPANVTESDKTDLTAYYSAALSNHKAILVDYDKNIISFAADGAFYVFSYLDGKFTERLREEIYFTSNIVRPMYIGDTFYIVTENDITCFNINTFDKLGYLQLK